MAFNPQLITKDSFDYLNANIIFEKIKKANARFCLLEDDVKRYGYMLIIFIYGNFGYPYIRRIEKNINEIIHFKRYVGVRANIVLLAILETPTTENSCRIITNNLDQKK